MAQTLSQLSSALFASVAGRARLRVDVEAIADDLTCPMSVRTEPARVALDEYFSTLLTLARRQHASTEPVALQRAS